MGGIIHFLGSEAPTIGANVMIVVDSVNRPTGIWQGILTDIGETYQSSWEKGFGANCTAEIINPAGSPIIPRVNYSVYLATAGTDYLIEKIAELEEKMKKLQNKARIEKEMSMALFKSAVNPDFANEFKKIMKELLGR